MIVCQMQKCTYNENGYCSKRVVGINAAGGCEQMYINNVPRRFFTPVPADCKDEINIFEAEEIIKPKEEKQNNE